MIFVHQSACSLIIMTSKPYHTECPSEREREMANTIRRVK